MYRLEVAVTFSLIACSAACSPSGESSSNQQARSQPAADQLSQISRSEQKPLGQDTDTKVVYSCDPDKNGQHTDKLCSSIAKEFLGNLDSQKAFKIACSADNALGYKVFVSDGEGWSRTYDGFTKPMADKFIQDVINIAPECRNGTRRIDPT
jgi:hypothetical protein